MIFDDTDAVNFAKCVFLKSYWIFDLVVCSAFGGWLGYTVQQATISEYEDPRGLPLKGAMVGVVSYLIACGVGFALSRIIWLPKREFIFIAPVRESALSKKRRIPSWVWLVGNGTLLFSIGHQVILVAWKSVDLNSPASLPEQMISLIFARSMLGNFFVGFLLFLPLFLFVLFTARAFAFLIYNGGSHLVKGLVKRVGPQA